MYKIYRLTSASGCYSDFTDRAFAEKELQNLIDNGKQGTITESIHYLPGELQAMADSAKAWNAKMNRPDTKSDFAHMVLELMETETHANNYCASLEEVLNNFPTVDRAELETELYKYI